MSDRMALKIAIDLMHVPSQVRLLRSEPSAGRRADVAANCGGLTTRQRALRLL